MLTRDYRLRSFLCPAPTTQRRLGHLPNASTLRLRHWLNTFVHLLQSPTTTGHGFKHSLWIKTNMGISTQWKGQPVKRKHKGSVFDGCEQINVYITYMQTMAHFSNCMIKKTWYLSSASKIGNRKSCSFLICFSDQLYLSSKMRKYRRQYMSSHISYGVRHKSRIAAQAANENPGLGPGLSPPEVRAGRAKAVKSETVCASQTCKCREKWGDTA